MSANSQIKKKNLW